MTIEEIQELICYADEKSGLQYVPTLNTTPADICHRLCETIRDANALDIDLTEVFVEWLRGDHL